MDHQIRIVNCTFYLYSAKYVKSKAVNKSNNDMLVETKCTRQDVSNTKSSYEKMDFEGFNLNKSVQSIDVSGLRILERGGSYGDGWCLTGHDRHLAICMCPSLKGVCAS